jgi:LPXTG-motif cell wall-anchored protein
MSTGTGPKTERQGMDWLIAGVLLILIVAVLVRLKKSEGRRQ